MKRGYKYRIYPTEEQKNYFKVCFAANRWFWNYALDKINAQYEKDKTYLSAQYKIARDLPSLKKEESTCWIGQCDAISFIYTAQALDASFKKFFKKEGGVPKYKSVKYDNSYTIQIQEKGKTIIDWEKSMIRIGKAGDVSIVLHRKFNGTIKSATVSKKSFDYYEVSLLVDDNFVKPSEKRIITYDGTVGIDLGVKSNSNVILSNGNKFPTIEVGRETKRIARLRRRLSKKEWKKTGEKRFSKKYGKEVDVKVPSKNYIKLKNRIAKLEDEIVRKRTYNTHMITSYVAKNPNINTVCIENLNVKGMVKNHHIAKSVSNANMGEVKRQLEYKCDWNGKNLVTVDRFYASSQICSCCGFKNEKVKNLSVRQWVCPNCGTHHDRDVNAALNIKNEGYRIITEGKQ